MRANPAIQKLIEKLEAQGVQMRTAWAARRSLNGKHDDTYCVVFRGARMSPKIGSGIILDHGNEGYSLFLAAEASTIDADVNAIMGWGVETPTPAA